MAADPSRGGARKSASLAEPQDQGSPGPRAPPPSLSAIPACHAVARMPAGQTLQKSATVTIRTNALSGAVN